MRSSSASTSALVKAGGVPGLALEDRLGVPAEESATSFWPGAAVWEKTGFGIAINQNVARARMQHGILISSFWIFINKPFRIFAGLSQLDITRRKDWLRNS